MLTRVSGLVSPLWHYEDEAETDNNRECTVDRPPGLAGHKAAGDDIDPLKELDASGKNE